MQVSEEWYRTREETRVGRGPGVGKGTLRESGTRTTKRAVERPHPPLFV